jgi:hypothetical protein
MCHLVLTGMLGGLESVPLQPHVVEEKSAGVEPAAAVLEVSDLM